VSKLSRDAMGALQAHDFPGNVRELKNSLEHAVIMARGDTVELEDLPKAMRSKDVTAPDATPLASPAPKTLAELREAWLAPLERKYLAELLDAHDGRVEAAAKVAGINRVTMYRLMQKHGLSVQRRVRA
jgi:DNA-binding NtrC family response regulator